MRPNLAWPLRSVLAGTAGTATMTAAYALERRLRPHFVGDLDYDVPLAGFASAAGGILGGR